MGKLIQAEFLKLSKLRAYKILLLCAVTVGVLFSGLTLGMQPEMVEEFGTPDGYSMFLSSLTDTQMYMILSVIFAAIFVCNEYTNRTFGMSLFSGHPRY